MAGSVCARCGGGHYTGCHVCEEPMCYNCVKWVEYEANYGFPGLGESVCKDCMQLPEMTAVAGAYRMSTALSRKYMGEIKEQAERVNKVLDGAMKTLAKAANKMKKGRAKLAKVAR